MKEAKCILIGVMAVLCAAFAGAAFQSPALDLVLLNQDPDPVEPGGIVELRFQMENKGGGAVEDVIVAIQPDYPFSLRPGDDAEISLGTIEGYTRGKDIRAFDYKLIVDPGAVEGEHEIVIRYRTGAGVWMGAWVEKTFKVNVRIVGANVAITKIESDPKEFTPGEEGILSVEVKNFGDTSVKDITLGLDFSDAGLPLAPIGTSSEQKADLLRQKGMVTFTYHIIAYPDAASRIYKVPASLTFYGQSGSQFSKNDVIAIIVGAAPKLQLTIEDTDVLQAGKAGDVTVRISNKGVNDVKFLTARIKGEGGITIIGADNQYVGGVDSDDFELVTFKVYVERGVKQAVLPLELEYRDANNHAYAVVERLELPLYSSSELRRFGLKKQSAWPVIIVLIAIAGGTFWWRRKRKK